MSCNNRQSEHEMIAIGKIRRPIGLAGDVASEMFEEVDLTSFEGVRVNIAGRVATIRKISKKNKGALRVKFSGCDTFEDADSLRNAVITAFPEDLPSLPDGKFYGWQILGMVAKDQDGKFLGTVSEVMKTGGNDVYVITDIATQTEILAPAISAAVLSIDVSQKVMMLATENCMLQPWKKG